MATDRELIERTQSGESEAYAELFRKYYQHIYTICFSMIRNPEDAEELAQEMFVHAYLKVDQLRDPAKFFPWLKKMARNRSKNFLQRREADVVSLSLVDMERSSVNPDEELLRHELIQAIMEAIEALPVKDRQVVRARIDGLSHAEIGRRFGISQQASLSRLYRARRKLADGIGDLLHSVFGLLKMLRSTELISGGIVAMKVSMGAKIIIGAVGVVVAGAVLLPKVMNTPQDKSYGVASEQQVVESADKHVATQRKEYTAVATMVLPKPADHTGKSERVEGIQEDISEHPEEEAAHVAAQREDTAVTVKAPPKEDIEEQDTGADKSSVLPEEPARELQQKILEAFRNVDTQAVIDVSKGKIRRRLEEEYEQFGEPTAEEAADVIRSLRISDSWYVGDDEFHFVLSWGDVHSIEYILQSDNTGWWLVDSISDGIVTEFTIDTSNSVPKPGGK
jgi:RNA polymerase sigma-70 factor (ECF subfamily)